MSACTLCRWSKITIMGDKPVGT